MEVEVSNESNIGSIKHQLGMGKIIIEVDNIYNSGGVNELKIPLVYSNGNKQKNKGIVTLRLHVDLVDEKSEHFHTADQIAVELGIRQFHLPLSQERAY